MNEHSQSATNPNDFRPSNENDRQLGSSFGDFFAGGASVWLKIGIGAFATPVAVVVLGLRAKRRGGLELPSPAIIAVILASSTLVGAVLGGLLTMKDVVQSRMAEGKPVGFPLKLLFGFGMMSLLFVWFPGIIFLTLVLTLLTLS